MPAPPSVVDHGAGDSTLRGFYAGRPVLVVGADGFLGVNFVHALERLGAAVSAFTRRERARAVGFTGTVIHGDLMDRSAVRAAVAGQSIVFDLAGVSGAVDSNENPDWDLEAACRPHLRLFHACADASPSPLVVFCSSRLVYGQPAYLPVDEIHAVQPRSMYAVHKITLEHYLEVLRHMHGLRSCILRLSNPYGPHQPARSRSYSVLNQFIRAAACGTSLTIYGDGSQERDYIHVDDVVTAFLLAAMSKPAVGQIFNLGGPRASSIRSVVEYLARIAGDVAVLYAPWPEQFRRVETGHYRTNLAKLEAVVALPPQLPLEVGLLRSLEFYRNEAQVEREAGVVALAGDPPQREQVIG